MAESLAQRILILRGQKQWTQQELAKRVGTTQRTVSTWESGKAVPSTRMRIRLANAFGLDANAFLVAVEVGTETEDDQEGVKKTFIYK